MDSEQIDELIKAFNSIAFQIKYLGGGDNGDTMGAVEFLAVSVKEGFSELANAIADEPDNSDAINGLSIVVEKGSENVGRGLYAVAESLSEVALAIRAHTHELKEFED